MPVPGVYGTTMRTSLPGHADCANARPANASDAALAASDATMRRRWMEMVEANAESPR